MLYGLAYSTHMHQILFDHSLAQEWKKMVKEALNIAI